MKLCNVVGCGGKHYARGVCATCYESARSKTPGKAEYQAKWRAANRDKLRALHKKYRERDPVRYREIQRKNKSLHSPELVAFLREYQQGRCAVCEETMTIGGGVAKNAEVADHCHAKMEPRGLLCAHCNRMLGHYESTRHLHARIEQYIADPPARMFGAK